MRTQATLEIGCAANGVTHHDTNIPDIDTKFRWVREAGVFDYIDRSPPDEEFAAVLKASERYSLPVRAGTGQYVMGRDEALYERHIIKARLLGARVHNIQLLTHHADGHPLSDAEVAEFYLRAQDFGGRHGLAPCFEVHVDMWSEHFGRIERVAALVESRGVPLRLTLDASHVVFKVDNPAQQAAQGMAADVASGRLVIDPRLPGHVIGHWVAAHRVLHAHARGAVPANPINTRAHHPDGRPGRGIQYPFTRPAPGEYVTDDWQESRLEPWKQVMRSLLQHHAREEASPLGGVSCEYIPFTDYGAGHGYSIFEQNVACAQWLRREWREACEHSHGQDST